jgi:hypothetical protein
MTALESLRSRLVNTSVPGLWIGVKLPGGEILESMVPISTFYHFVGAIAALTLAWAI